jgi:aryl-alcohol dehydrogenase-like predicted oxidoreductase
LAQKPWIVLIPGTTQFHHLSENAGAVNVAFSAEELKEFDAELITINCRGIGQTSFPKAK